MPSPSPISDLPTTRLAINAPWLVKLRWVAIVGQLATVAYVVYGLEIQLPIVPLIGALGITGITNLALDWWARRALQQPVASSRVASSVIAGVMLLDLVVLTAMLYFTGGPTNPFVVFYFVNLALAGVLLQPRLAWLLEAVACAGMALLFWQHWQVPVLSDPTRLTTMASEGKLPLAAVGEFVAVVAASGVIVAFMTRVTSELRASEQARSRAEEQRARSEKLEALGTLAAGAAHELATPLSTIAVVATEVERELAGRDLPEGIANDLTLVRRELERCRAILDRMSVDAGQLTGEALSEITVPQLVELIIKGIANPDRVTFTSHLKSNDIRLTVPHVALAQALRGLVQNGLDATTAGLVTLTATDAVGNVQIEITDHGPGMAAEVLARAGEPFFTTKQPGQGMGLGVFLARSVIERLGGTVELRSTVELGTRAVVTLPTQQ